MTEFKNKEFTKSTTQFENKVCFIPARYPSTRLPGKPLLEIKGIAIIERVYQQVKKCHLVDKIIVLTDDKRIKDKVESFGGNCEIVTEECLNGTERIIKYIQKNIDCCDLVINVQGDEPFIDPTAIDKCIANYIKQTDSSVKCSTLHHKLDSEEEIRKRSNGKLVLDNFNNIMYCSRNIIPGTKKNEYDKHINYYGHIGIFVFDKTYLLEEYTKENTPNQLNEDIEWLKILEQGYRINSVCVDDPEISVDTKEDYIYLLDKYK